MNRPNESDLTRAKRIAAYPDKAFADSILGSIVRLPGGDDASIAAERAKWERAQARDRAEVARLKRAMRLMNAD